MSLDAIAHRSIDIVLEPLTAEKFEPFGQVIDSDRDEFDFEMPNRMIELEFEIDGSPKLFIIRYIRQAMVANRFERHLTMTEARVSLGESAVVVVAAPSDINDRIAFPATDSVRAFLLRAGQGIIFNKGIWHALDCYPLSDYADFAFLTEAEAENELNLYQEADTSQCKRSHFLDFHAQNVEFRVVDPDGLISGD